MSGLEKFRKLAQKRKANLIAGGINALPMPFARYNEAVKGISTGRNILITAETGVGKTKLAKFLMFRWLQYMIKLGIKCTVVYFCLESTEEEFWAELVSIYLLSYKNIEVSPSELLNDYEPLPEYIEGLVNEAETVLKKFEEYLVIIDNVYTPTRMYKRVRNEAAKIGQFYLDRNPVSIDEMNNLAKPPKMFSYSKSPDKMLMIITDNLDLLEPEKGAESLWLAMRRWTKLYGTQEFVKKFNSININLQQLAAQDDNTKDKRYQPTLNKLGDNKQIARDMDFVWALYAPIRYDIPNHQGYDITQLKDRYRSLYVLKDRHRGTTGKEVPLLFKGEKNHFEELPFPKEIKNYKKYI